MGIINTILPEDLKPISRNIGYSIKSLLYKIRCINSKVSPCPIFILGNQKSGTSAIASLLGELISKKTAIDLFYSGFKYKYLIRWKKKKLTTKEFINKNKLEFSSDIIKEPHLSVFYKELKKEYPKSKYIIIIRNPFDNIRSILDRLNVNGKQKELSVIDKKKFFFSWNLLLDNKWIGGFETQYIEVLAERWNIITDYYLNNKEDIILIKYEDFLSNKESVIRRLAKQLGISAKNNITNILDKQYQPKGRKKNINLLEFFGKENYNKINYLCKKRMQKLGY